MNSVAPMNSSVEYRKPGKAGDCRLRSELREKPLRRRGLSISGSRGRSSTRMPHTRGALASGRLTEWRATILVRETAYLTRETREEIDRRVCADPATLDGVGDRQLEALAKQHAYELEPQAVVDRKAKAEKDRRVSVRPAPDLMTQLSALLPMKQGISVYATLKRYADSVVGADDRSHAQIMADTLVERVTGQKSADAVPVAVNLVMSSDTMLGGVKAAEVPGYGPIPASVARRLVSEGFDPDSETTSTLRRLYARPSDGTLVSMDAKSRCFPAALALFVARRDRRCRVCLLQRPRRTHRPHPRPPQRWSNDSRERGGAVPSSQSGQGTARLEVPSAHRVRRHHRDRRHHTLGARAPKHVAARCRLPAGGGERARDRVGGADQRDVTSVG